MAKPVQELGPIGAERAQREVCFVLGVSVDRVSYDQAVARIDEMIQGGGPHQVVLANANTLNLAYADTAYQGILEGSALVLRDGIGVKLAARVAGARLGYNFVGTEFVPAMLKALGHRHLRVALFGAKPGRAAIAAEVLQQRCPGVRVVAAEHGYGDHEAAVRKMAAADPDVLLVALGNPLQERWIAKNLDRLNTRVAIGVGALFDYLAGDVPRAPKWVRRIQCEWMFRLYIEPRRLCRRYLIGGVQFLWRAGACSIFNRGTVRGRPTVSGETSFIQLSDRR